jgi:hypothetical protein
MRLLDSKSGSVVKTVPDPDPSDGQRPSNARSPEHAAGRLVDPLGKLMMMGIDVLGLFPAVSN